MGIETIVGSIFPLYEYVYNRPFPNSLSHKNKMEELYDPCEWKYVGKQTDIKNPVP